jgi:hypothetical protein
MIKNVLLRRELLVKSRRSVSMGGTQRARQHKGPLQSGNPQASGKHFSQWQERVIVTQGGNSPMAAHKAN